MSRRRSLRLGEGNGPALPDYGVVFNINYSAQLTAILPAAADAIDEVGPVGSSLACTFCVVRTDSQGRRTRDLAVIFTAYESASSRRCPCHLGGA